MAVSDYVTSLCSDENRAILTKTLLLFHSSENKVGRCIHQLFEFLDDEAEKRPQINSRIEPFLVESLLRIIQGYAQPKENKDVKKRSRKRNEKFRGRAISASSHYTSELIHYLMFRSGHSFNLFKPLVSQRWAARFVAGMLCLIELEHPSVNKDKLLEKLKRSKRADELGEIDLDIPEHEWVDAYNKQKVLTLEETLTQKFRDWNVRQLPNMPRAVYSSTPGRPNISRSAKEIRKSQIRLESNINKVKHNRHVT